MLAPDGNGGWAVSSSRRFAYDGDRLAAEFDGNNALVRSYAWGPTGLLAVTDYAGLFATTYTAVGDGDGNVVALLDATGAVAASFAYGAWGDLKASSGAAAGLCPIGWGGGYRDAETGLVFLTGGRGGDRGANLYNFRGNDPVNDSGGSGGGSWSYYSPAQGRFLTRDPAVTGAGVIAFTPGDAAVARGGVGYGGGSGANGTYTNGDWAGDFATGYDDATGYYARERAAGAVNLLNEFGAALADAAKDELFLKTYELDRLFRGDGARGFELYQGSLSSVGKAFDTGQMKFGWNPEYRQFVGSTFANAYTFGAADGVAATYQGLTGQITMDEWGERFGNMGSGMILAGVTMPEGANLLLDRPLGCIVRQAFEGAGEICFAAGTPVLTAGGRREIESLAVGRRVLTEGTKAGGDRDDPTGVDPAGWRLVALRMARANGNVLDVRLLRPVAWVEQAGAKAGGRIFLSLPELLVEGRAEVLSVGECPPVEGGRGRVVTATFTQSASPVLRVRLRDSGEVIEATRPHPFYSEDRADWAAAGDLRPGERVRTAAGRAAVVEAVTPKPGAERVYNFEVEDEHHYYVGLASVLVHNTYARFYDDASVTNLRGRSLNSGTTALKRIGLQRVLGRAGAYEFVDPKTGIVRAKWVPRMGMEPQHWSKFTPTGDGQYLNNAGRLVDSIDRSHRVPSNGGSPRGGTGPGSPGPILKVK